MFEILNSNLVNRQELCDQKIKIVSSWHEFFVRNGSKTEPDFDRNRGGFALPGTEKSGPRARLFTKTPSEIDFPGPRTRKPEKHEFLELSAVIFTEIRPISTPILSKNEFFWRKCPFSAKIIRFQCGFQLGEKEEGGLDRTRLCPGSGRKRGPRTTIFGFKVARFGSQNPEMSDSVDSGQNRPVLGRPDDPRTPGEREKTVSRVATREPVFVLPSI